MKILPLLDIISCRDGSEQSVPEGGLPECLVFMYLIVQPTALRDSVVIFQFFRTEGSVLSDS